MRAGLLRYRWTIQKKPASPTKSASGQETYTPVDVATVWAAEVPTTGAEILRSGQEIAQQTTILSIRYRAGISPRMWATRNGRTLDIQQVINVGGRKRELQLLCTEVVQ